MLIATDSVSSSARATTGATASVTTTARIPSPIRMLPSSARMATRTTAKRSGRRAGLQTARSSIADGHIRTKVWLEHDGRFVMGDGGLRLLEAIERPGSLGGAGGAGGGGDP